ncbi:MAG: tetratricopeptide repeat protein, partial [Cyanobacteria bacterium P01_H01_bin.105]
YYANINYQLGNQYRQKGELPIAIAYYRQAIHLNPDLTDVRQSLRTALEENDNVTIKVSCAKA